MKVTKANVYIVETGSYRPVIVELLTDEGISGAGEAAVGFGIGANASATMIYELSQAFVIGKDPFRIMDIWNDCYYDTFWGKGAGAIFYSAVSAIEMALWDIKGKAFGLPIYEMLGGKMRENIPCYANDWCFNLKSTEELAGRAAEVVADGYSAIKLYPLSRRGIGSTVNKHIRLRDVTREEELRCIDNVRAVRKAIGDNVELLVDVTAEGTPSTMIRIGRAIEQYKPYYYEEPLDAFDIDSYVQLKAHVELPIATGERLYTRYGFRRLIENRGVDIVQPDPGTTGGIFEAFKIAAMAEAHQMQVAPHNCGGPVLTAACMQLSACLSNLAMQEVFPYRPQIHYDIVENPMEKQITCGKFAVTNEPGLGVKLNHALLKQFIVATAGEDRIG